MRTPGRRAFLSSCFGVFAAGVVRPAAAQPMPSSIWWRSSYPSSRQEAFQSRRPLAMVFMTKTCPWCRVMDRTTFRDLEVVNAMNRRFVPVRIDTEDARNLFLVDWLKIRSMPTTVIACHKGNLINSQEGYLDPMLYLGFLNRSHVFSSIPRDNDVTAR